ncbi:right-handed parallel beta-helix repeat-containing protein [Algibacter sp. L3A6]|uniref:right-handed parallel beta-helix repeat-containing protein n=1 Tax=Algibacter sp. L3A6 TaxID=2686366 RepID=UPI00131AE6F9|nr:right-handed parallel beta-helix repeat-containing protein [Algibacter sp. L3A6]
MKHFLLTLILGFILVSCSNSLKGKITKGIYVDIEGDNSGTGSILKPYATLQRAVKASRDLRKTGLVDPIVIYLRGGRHQLNEALVLGIKDGRPEDSEITTLDDYGAGETILPAYLTISAYPKEHAVVSAGMPITGWKKVETTSSGLLLNALGNVWEADMPEGLENFYTLYDSKGRLNRARNNGFSPTQKGDKTHIYFPEGALKNWENIEDVEVQVRPFRPWVINMLPLKTVDETELVAQTGVSATYGIDKLPSWVHNPTGSSIWIENSIEALNEPGEWVVNTKTRKIYLWPVNPSSDGKPQGILAPTTSELIRVEGQIDYDGPTDKPVNGIAFNGITFTHADRLAWTSDEKRLGLGMQHDWDMFDKPSAMIRFRGAENCEVINCDFLNSGGSGIRLDLFAQRNRIENCEFAHLGEAGILLAGYGAGTKDVNHHNDIINNHIHHFSEITWHSPGIWAWQSGHNHMAHNYVHHSGYAAVLITNRIEPDRSLNGEGGRTIRQNEIPEDVKTSTKETVLY